MDFKTIIQENNAAKKITAMTSTPDDRLVK